MSHFITIVVTRDGQDPEELLEPFVESYDGNSPPYFFKFQVEVEKKDFKKKAIEIVGKIEKMEKDDKDIKKWKNWLNEKKYTKILENWFGGELHNGNWGYWNNPHAKWDWYELGGRWAGYLKAKKGKKGEVGTPSWGCGENWKYPKGYFDVLNFEDIDWDGMIENDVKEFIKRYQKASKEYNEWFKDEEKKYDYKKKGESEKFVEAKKKKLQEIDFSSGIDLKENMGDHIDKIYGSQNSPHAFITPDGEWYEKGEMGWWAIITDEKPLEYRKAWNKLLKESKPDDKFWVYDLHI